MAVFTQVAQCRIYKNVLHCFITWPTCNPVALGKVNGGDVFTIRGEQFDSWIGHILTAP